MNIDEILKEARYFQASDWKEKVVEHTTPTGQKRKVKVKSLSPEEQEKYRPKKKKVLNKVLDKVKNWKEEHKKFFYGGHLPESKERKNFSNFIKTKVKGISTAVKNEVKNWKEAASGVKKIFRKEKLSDKERKAIKDVAKHVALTAGTMAVTGGIGMPLATLVRGMGIRLLQGTALKAVRESLLFASVMTDDKAIEILIHDLANAMNKMEIKEDEWSEIIDKVNM